MAWLQGYQWLTRLNLGIIKKNITSSYIRNSDKYKIITTDGDFALYEPMERRCPHAPWLLMFGLLPWKFGS